MSEVSAEVPMPEELQGRQMSDWQAATVTLLIALVVAALAWAIIDPDGIIVAAEASSRLWVKIIQWRVAP